MGPQVQPKCFRHPQHMRNNWELRKRGYLIRFGHTEALLLKKYDIKRPFFPPCRNWPICNSKVGAMWGYSLVMFKHLIVRKCEKFHRLKHVCFFRPRYVSNYAGTTQFSIILILKHRLQTTSPRSIPLNNHYYFCRCRVQRARITWPFLFENTKQFALITDFHFHQLIKVLWI